MTKTSPHLWYTDKADEAAAFHASPERLAPLEYPAHFLVKKITTAGTFRFQDRLLHLANALVDQHIGLEQTDDGI